MRKRYKKKKKINKKDDDSIEIRHTDRNEHNLCTDRKYKSGRNMRTRISTMNGPVNAEENQEVRRYA